MKKYLISSFVLLLGALGVQAGNNVYTGNAGDNDFNNDANWWNPVDPTDSIFFRGDNIETNSTWAFLNLSAPDTVARVVFQASVYSNSYTFSGETLIIDGNGDNQAVLIESQAANTNVQTFANSVELVSINNANNKHIKTTGTGTLIFSGSLSQGSASQGVGIGLGYGDFEISGNVDGAGKLWKFHNDAGDGIAKFTGSGIWSGGGTVQISTGAEMLLARDTTDSSGFMPDSVQIGGGILTLGNDEQIGDAANVYYTVTDGGLFDLDGYTESVGQLVFDRETIYGVLDLGDGGALHIENQSSTAKWGTSLIVTGWTSGSDHIYVDGGSFSSSQLAAITFDGYAAGAKVEGGELLPAGASLGFSGWIDDYNLTAGDDAADADPDGDGVANLYEYGFGGNPTNAAVTGTLPVFEFSGSTVEIVHVERTDLAGVISYSVQQTPELVSPAWTAVGISLVGESTAVDGFKTVTNQVSADAAAKFLKVFVEQD
jgi:hypothetical protein